ncbi:epidermal growth factor-like protein 6 [Danio aesculapii]|uniref:epidermal growth factor-like protein 6 n=1 Tax=Danio aesculapii TaxID=1142201 RepID=UPI0024BFB45E|nr:epidermal growth factor-like protein 6 [Danio aesculapii]
MKHLTWISALSFLLYFTLGTADHRQRRQVSVKSVLGVCRYGSRLECCYGWKKNSKGQCEAQCDLGCKHGECVGPNKCKCFPGYTGKTCSQDLNECGLKPRPCEHRCMNTFGSYMCYCLNGYMLMPDGSCANSRTCSLAHCQYGCEEVQSEVRCLCPSPGLQLGTDGKTCEDIDECATGKNQCPFNRQCTNTFGSYYCKCQPGYDLKYINGKYDCTDVNECASNTHKCSHHAECINTHGSYKCKCKQGFRGSGFDCSVKPFYHRSWDSSKGNPDVFVNGERDAVQWLNEQMEVFLFAAQDDFVSVYESESELKEIQAAPLRERFLTDCDFDRGACEWVQDNADDLDWTIKYHPNGREYYLALEGPVGNRREQARMKLLLEDHMRQSSFCLRFDFRIEGPQTGVLRVKLDNSAISIWERKQSQKQSWQSEQISISWTDDNPEAVVFEAERGRSGTGEIALDHVLLISGECSEDKTLDF